MNDMVISTFQSSTSLQSFWFLEDSAETDAQFAVHPHTGQIVEIDPEQAWFWAPEWLADEILVDWQLQNGHYEDFDDIDALFADL